MLRTLGRFLLGILVAVAVVGGVTFSINPALFNDVAGAALSIAHTLTKNPNLEAGLVGHWTFDGAYVDWASTTAEVRDRTNNANHGNTNSMGAANAASGVLGQALVFDSSEFDYINVGSDTSIDNLFTAGGTISAWIKPEGWGSANYGRVADGTGGTSAGWIFYVDNDSFQSAVRTLSFQYYFSTTDGLWSVPTDAITLNEWQHVVVVYDNGGTTNDPQIYINGVLQSFENEITPVGTADTAPTASVYIGNNVAAGRTFDGAIDDVRFYNREISPEEIQRLYELGNTTRIGNTLDKGSALKDSLVGHWTFDGGLFDSSTATSSVNAAAVSGTVSGAAPSIGAIGQGALFDGADDYVNIGSDITIDDIFDGGGTISAWIKPEGWGEGDFGRILDKSNGASVGYVFYVDNNTFLSAVRTLSFQQFFTTTAGVWASPTDSLSLNEWQHVVITYDDGATTNDPIFYINGEVQTFANEQTPVGTAQSDAASTGYIGNSLASDRTFDGSIDDVRAYDRILSADEVTRLYQLGNTTRVGNTIKTQSNLENGLVAHWTFDGDTLAESFVSTDTGWQNYDSVGATNQWTNPANAASSDNVYASADTFKIQTYGFDMNLDSSVYTVDGIQVRAEGGASGTTKQLLTLLSWDDETSWTSQSRTLGVFDDSDPDEVREGGGSTDTWGRTWTADELNAPNFAMYLFTYGTFYVDHVQTKAWYTTRNATATDIVAGIDGVLTGALSAPGVAGQAMEFDGSDDYLEMASAAALNNIDTAVTVAAWVYPHDTGNAAIFEKSISDVTNSQFLLFGESGYWKFRIDDGGLRTTPGSSGNDIVANQWQHVVGSYDGSTVRLYVDGVEKSTFSYTGDIDSGAGIARIGELVSVGTYDFDGVIDDVRVYDRALSAEEIVELYELGT